LSDEQFGTRHYRPETLTRQGLDPIDIEARKGELAKEAGLWWGAAKWISPEDAERTELAKEDAASAASIAAAPAVPQTDIATEIARRSIAEKKLGATIAKSMGIPSTEYAKIRRRVSDERDRLIDEANPKPKPQPPSAARAAAMAKQAERQAEEDRYAEQPTAEQLRAAVADVHQGSKGEWWNGNNPIPKATKWEAVQAAVNNHRAMSAYNDGKPGGHWKVWSGNFRDILPEHELKAMFPKEEHQAIATDPANREKLVDAIARVNKTKGNEPEGGWTDADKVPLNMQHPSDAAKALLKPTPQPKAAHATTPAGEIARFPGENGTESIVTRRPDGQFSVALRDMDSGETVQHFTIFPTEAAAVAHAKTVSLPTPPISEAAVPAASVTATVPTVPIVPADTSAVPATPLPKPPIGQSKADAAKDAATVAKFRDRPKVELLRAPAGGKTSEVDGVFYKGGQLMPVHGLSVKSETDPNTPKFEGGGAGKPNENAADPGKRKPRNTEMSPEEIEAERSRRKREEDWSTVSTGPMGKALGLGDRPHGIRGGWGSSKNWREVAEEHGEDKIKKVMEAAKARAIEATRDEIAKNPWMLSAKNRGLGESDLTPEEAMNRYLEHQEYQLSDLSPREYGYTAKHLAKNPSTLAASFWVAEMLGQKGIDQSAELRKLHDILEGKAEEPAAQPAAAATESDAPFYGDTVQSPDGTVGTMRGSGGMGSGRVGVEATGPDGKPFRQWENAADLKKAEQPAPAATQPPTTKPAHPLTAAVNKAAGVQDFGEEIPDARKHLAKPTGPRAPKAQSAEKDTRSTWEKKYNISRIDKASKPGEEGKFAVYNTKDLSPWTKQPKQIGTLFDSEEEAKNALPLLEVSQKHRVYKISRSGEPDEYAIIRRVSDRKIPAVKRGFKTEQEAMAHLAANPREIIEHKFPHYEDYKYLSSVDRIGGPKRPKEDIKPDDFQSKFHFRGGQFGNWQQGKDGQTALNHAYDSLTDLADALNIPPSAISLNGDLAIGFGARGTGGKDAALAHYEPNHRVMNLTKMAGAGSLAHEYGHALDHYFGKLSGLPGLGKAEHMFSSEAFPRDNKLRPEVTEAWKGIVKAMQERSETTTMNPEKYRGLVEKAKKDVDYQLSQVEDRLKPSSYRKVKPFTPAEQKQWDEAVAKIRSGDLGDSLTVRPKGVGMMNPGRLTFAPIETLNDLVKKATGRQFFNSSGGSLGDYLYSKVRHLRDANATVAKAETGATSTSKRPTDFLRNARDLDSTRTSDYYQLNHEMFARAFESYVHDKLESQGRRSDYLVANVKNGRFPEGMKPYPEGEERQTINAAFDKLFEAIKHEPVASDKGERHRIYSRGEDWTERDVPTHQPPLVARLNRLISAHA
jgi:hypothetical protein